jgi:asparagine synthetase B (glutamine-hydrolysing)
MPTELAVYEGVVKLDPGDAVAIHVDGSGWETRHFPTFLPEVRADTRMGFDEAKDELRRLVRNAVEKRLESDVPLGAFLSGGVDSSLVVAVMARDFGRTVETFSIGFDDPQATEHVFARETARLLGTNHHDAVLSPDALTMLPEIAARLDEPNGDSSCLPTLLLSRFTRQFVTVALSGDGGDELFGGYGRYRDTLNETGEAPQGWLARLGARMSGRDVPARARRGVHGWIAPAAGRCGACGVALDAARPEPHAAAADAGARHLHLHAGRGAREGRPHEHAVLARGAVPAARPQARRVRRHAARRHAVARSFGNQAHPEGTRDGVSAP